MEKDIQSPQYLDVQEDSNTVFYGTAVKWH